ncbi:kinase-like domain-containing protein [Polychytrium aggregatum]|uniref:kinase-like domain-containing protein n=1 Tax=Polychytrium aggregatum TaxID=110093 RepID=UPI0022FF3A9D|nr:kinase-like domain-containing protein [Polychytrium aggregatum]KAI9205378.1 kinase-like domain-containing protein [Polychytrium aggregatum]
MIGKGGFGEVYKALDLTTGERIAVKIEHPTAKKKVLRLEAGVLRRLQGRKHIPQLHACGRYLTYPISSYGPGVNVDDVASTYVVMQLLGPNLSEVRKKTKTGRFSLSTTALLGKQMIKAIREIHEIGIIHRDIKPGNFCIGLPSTEGQPGCYLVDFGLARKFTNGSGQHRYPREKAGFKGTATYASLHAHQEKDLSRVDDLWPLLYITIEFLNGQLPWKGKEKAEIKHLKETMSMHDLCQGLPEPVVELYRYLASLQFFDEPSYDYLESLYDRLLQLSGCPPDVGYDWETPPEGMPSKLEQLARSDPQLKKTQVASSMTTIPLSVRETNAVENATMEGNGRSDVPSQRENRSSVERESREDLMSTRIWKEKTLDELDRIGSNSKLHGSCPLIEQSRSLPEKGTAPAVQLSTSCPRSESMAMCSSELIPRYVDIQRRRR